MNFLNSLWLFQNQLKRFDWKFFKEKRLRHFDLSRENRSKFKVYSHNRIELNWLEEESFIGLSSNAIYRISSKWNHLIFSFFVHWTIFENIFDKMIIYHWLNENGCVLPFWKARNDLSLFSFFLQKIFSWKKIFLSENEWVNMIWKSKMAVRTFSLNKSLIGHLKERRKESSSICVFQLMFYFQR